MLFLEDQHRPKADGVYTARPDVDTDTLHLFQERPSVDSIKCDVRSVELISVCCKSQRSESLTLGLSHAGSVSVLGTEWRVSRALCRALDQLVPRSGSATTEICKRLQKHTHCLTRFLLRISSMTALHMITRAASPIHLHDVSHMSIDICRSYSRVELAVSLIRLELAIGEEISSGLCFLGKGDDVGRRG